MQLTFKHGRLKRSAEEMEFLKMQTLNILWGISQIYLNTAQVYSCHTVGITPVMLNQVHIWLLLG